MTTSTWGLAIDGSRARITRAMAKDFAASVVAALEQTLRARRTANSKDLARVAGQLGQLEELSEGLTGLETRLGDAHREVAALRETYGRTDPTDLATEVESEVLRVAELEPRPRATADEAAANDAARTNSDAEDAIVVEEPDREA